MGLCEQRQATTVDLVVPEHLHRDDDDDDDDDNDDDDVMVLAVPV